MIVPEVFSVEVAHNIVKAVRNRKLGKRLALDELAELQSLPIEARPIVLPATERFNLAQDWLVSVFDVLYLTLAIDSDAPLCCRDGSMKAAAEKLGVAIFAP